MITIVNYGMGNLGSVLNMFKRVGVAAEIVSDVEKIGKATKLLLPGVGAFDTAMTKISETPGLLDVLNEKALKEKVPVLGICLGMQLLTNESEEGTLPGLGWINAKTARFRFTDSTLKIPHMGWNHTIPQKPSLLLNNLPDDARFYFVHSYYVQVNAPSDSLFKTNYGILFDSGVEQGNIFGAQFHPEKSHKYGMKLLENFSKL